MSTTANTTTPRLLGAAFLFQAIASFVAGVFLLQPLIVEDSITETMTTIADHALQMRAGIVVHVLTAIGIAALGALLYVALKKQSAKTALIALSLYLVEATILAVSRLPAFALLRVSQQSVSAGHPDYLQALGQLFYESSEFGSWLHMLAFGVGATLFYYLFFKSGFIPRILALWGLIAAPLALIGTVLVLLGYDVPFLVFFPNFPFELTIGVWLIVKGLREGQESR